MTVRGVHPLHFLRARGTRESRRVPPIATKRNGYPALRREAGAPRLGDHEGGAPPSWGSYKGAGPLRRSPRGRLQSRVGDGSEAYWKQYVEGLNGEPARVPALQGAGRLVAAANPGYSLLGLDATGEQQKCS